MRQRTCEWQVCGVCNYDCSYCIQKKATRVGQPSTDEVEGFLRFFESLPGRWEVKMTGGEPFAFKAFLDRIVPGLIERTPHVLSVLTNLSAPPHVLEHFANLTRGRLAVVSASLHLEFADVDAFVEKAKAFKAQLSPGSRMVVNGVLVPGRLEAVAHAKAALERAGLKFFPQIMKVKGGTHTYDPADAPQVAALVGQAPTPMDANMSPSYRGRLCWTGVDYFVLTQRGDGWSCRTARRFDEGFLGNVLDGSFRLRQAPARCGYDICPCTVPANRGMIEGVGAGRVPEEAA